MSSWIAGRRGRALPWLALLVVLAGTLFVDRYWQNELASARLAAEARANEEASVIADAFGNAISERIGALAAARMRFTSVEDSVSERTFSAAVDSVTVQLTGLNAISVVTPAGRVSRGSDALLGRLGLDPAQDSLVRDPFARAVAARQPTATGQIQRYGARRLIYFDPVIRNDSVVAVMAAEMDPLIVFRSAVSTLDPGEEPTDLYGLYGPSGTRITTLAIPPAWQLVGRAVRIADTEWVVRVGFAPPPSSLYTTARFATWITGLVLGGALAAILAILRRTVGSQRDEIRRREQAEGKAQSAARESQERALEARELSAQLEAAHGAAQKLSTSLDPDYVLEFFLGVVGETLSADTASLFTFDDEGELLVGRKRLVLNDTGPETQRLRREDIKAVRVPVAMLPQLARAASTGQPQVVPDAASMEDGEGIPAGIETAAAWLTIPLQVAGHMIGVAIWESYDGPKTYDPKDIAFAQALAAQAAAALRTAELYASLEQAGARATREAARFGAVLDQMADGVVIVDASGRVERFNEAAEDVLGDRPASASVWEWVSALELSTLDHRPFADDFPILRALRGESVRRAGFLVHGGAGEERYLSASASPIVAPDGRQAGAAMVVRNVTDEQQYAGMLRHTNQELRKQAAVLEETNQRLREATAAKDRFLAVMSHELRTPLNGVIGYADLLELQIKGPLNDEQKVMVHRVIETAKHLLALIDEILDVAKVSSGEVDLVMEPVWLESVVEGACDQITPLANSKGIALEWRDGGGERDLWCFADRRRLTQVVLNLLSNAVKFTDSGTVSIHTRRRGEERVELTVSDTGPGIPKDLHERIFEDFYQVEGGLTRSSGGTGLGLAIARRYARLMEGDLTVDSEPGEGAAFILVLPAAPAKRDASEAPAPATEER